MEWFVLEFFIFSFDLSCYSMEGGELFNRIRDRQDKPYTEREAARIILMIAKAVAHLHHMDMVKKSRFFLLLSILICILIGSS